MASGNSAFEFEDHRSHCVIVFRPVLNDEWTRVAQHGKDMLQQLQRSRRRHLLLDLQQLDSCGSAVVAVMVNLWKEVKQRQGTLSVCCPSRIVRETLDISKLSDYWNVYENREEAEESLEPIRRRTVWATAWLLALGAIGLGATITIAIATRRFGIVSITLGATTAVTAAMAVGARFGARWWAVVARVWLIAVIAASLLTLGFVFGRGALSMLQKLGCAGALLAASAVAWMAWSSLADDDAALTEEDR